MSYAIKAHGEALTRRPVDAGPLRFAYADPPYPRQAKRHYGGHEDYAGEVDHRELIDRLVTDYPDGWALSTGAVMLRDVLALCPAHARVAAWVKPMTPYKPNVSVQHGWEPVIFCGGRRRGDRPMIRDWISLSPVPWKARGESGAVIGMKPDGFCFWLFDCLGASAGDTLDDLYPGSGAVTAAWQRFLAQPQLSVPPKPEQPELEPAA